MSLLDRGPHTVTVFPAVEVDDGYGGTEPGEGPAQEVSGCLVQPSSSEEQVANGWGDITVYRVFHRVLPGGPWSRVVWDGSDWTVVGQPQHLRGSRATRYDVAYIRRR